MTSLYKVLAPGRKACNGGKGVWPEPGEWLHVKGRLVPCRHGLHVCAVKDLTEWLRRPCEVWRVEVDRRYKWVEEPTKIVVRRARLLESLGTLESRDLGLLACDFAERVLPLYEEKHPRDDRPRVAIETARRYADGGVTRKEMYAARYAAYVAYETAVAAGGELDVGAAMAAHAAAEDTARASTSYYVGIDAAWAAAGGDTERVWQGQRILDYLRER